MLEKEEEFYSSVIRFCHPLLVKDTEIYIKSCVFDYKEVCLSWQGICEGLLEITGVEGKVVKSSCQLEGDNNCEYVVRYEIDKKNKEYGFKSYMP